MTDATGRDQVAVPTRSGPDLRRALAVVAALAALGAMVELALIGHWEGIVQLIPWWVCEATLAAAWCVGAAPSPRRIAVARVLSIANITAGVGGVASHLDANWSISEELNGAEGGWTIAIEALRGRIPLLAPLVLALPSVLVLLATWGHPARRQEVGVAVDEAAAAAASDAAVSDAAAAQDVATVWW